ncbi:MAG TPA: ABC transporter ATP-binding protein [Candidatus Saccharimonadales bacterium]|nr:ABC transporter ATP-binding protein [Candidatus Saccharimonadales bacterium]
MNIDRDTIRIFWQAGLHFKRDLILAAGHSLGAICFTMIIPLLVGRILAALGQNPSQASHYIPYFIAAAAAGIILNRVGFAHLLMYQAKTMSYLQSRALEVLLRRSVGFHNNNVGGKLVSDAIDYPTGFSQLTNALFANLLPLAVILTVGTAIVFFESWQLGLLVAAMAVYAVGSGLYESRKRAPIRQRRLKVTKAVTSHLADTIVNVQTVKTFAREGDELAQHNDLNHRLRNMRLDDWISAARGGNRRIATLLVAQLAFIVLVIHLVTKNPELLAIGIFAFAFTITLSNRLFEINVMLRTLEDGLLQASPLTQILLEDVEIKDIPDAKPLKVKQGTIDITDVSFTYQDSSAQQAVFARLNLSVTPGEKIGLVGPSGGGKSTLTRLLLRFDDIDSGTIAIDSQDISRVTQSSLRQAISYVPQEPLLFHRSVHENIAYGKPGATRKQVIAAARSAHADEFIAHLTNGYDTIVGERGVKLSGGQRQRIAIARAILKDAPILLLDEATSALDSESEALIQDALWKLMQGRTTIVIAHRLSTIQRMDRIIVLDKGKIIEKGSHKQLLTKKGLYATLWSHQSGGFIEE